MSALGNLPGYQPGIRAAELLGYWFRTRPVTDSLTTPVGGPATEPPHVRAIASRPVPSRPFQTFTDGEIHDHNSKSLNSNVNTLPVVAAVARRTPARERAHEAAA